MARIHVLSAAFAILLAAGCVAGTASAAGAGRLVPPPAVDESAASTRTSEVAVVAGGCFWGVQGVYQHVKGVTSAVSGYAGGAERTAEYEMVGTGRTGHAESVRIVFDPRVISYGRVLQIFFSVAHDPTQRDRQGPDIGPQYRSAIFPVNADQKSVAEAYIEQLGQSHSFSNPIVTTIEPSKVFYPAEDYHQDYLVKHPNQRYIVINDLHKVESLRALFPTVYQAQPVLVAPGRS
jgi:peptide-methionine (S)-S-oxide reductase